MSVEITAADGSAQEALIQGFVDESGSGLEGIFASTFDIVTRADGARNVVTTFDYDGRDQLITNPGDKITTTFGVNATLEDENGNRTSGVLIVPTNGASEAPTFTSTPPTDATEGELYSYDFSASGVDPLTFSLDTAPDGMSLDSANRRIEWTPDGFQLGLNPVALQVIDGRGGSATQSFNVDVASANQAPAITSTPPTDATVGELYVYDFTVSDPDGDPLTFSLETAPDGMTIDSANRRIEWTPDGFQLGLNPVTLQVIDGRGGSATQSFNVDVAQGPAPPPQPGDGDGDGDVDRDDVGAILLARNQPASGPDDPRDLNGDGFITVLDARLAVVLCTRPRCATE